MSNHENTNSTGAGGRKLTGPVIAAIALIAVLFAGFIFASYNPVADSAKADAPVEETTQDAEYTADELAQIAERLTVHTTSIQCTVNDLGLIDFNIGALEAVPEPRKWSDAISTPFGAQDPEAIRDELQEAICQDPVLGTSWLSFLVNEFQEHYGIDLAAMNPWIADYATSVDQIDEVAAGFIPLLDVAEPTDEQILQAVEANKKWQQRASYIGTLLDKFALGGVEARPSIVNYHLKDGGLVVGALPAVEKNPQQESLEALVFEVTLKDQCEPLASMGANIHDKRPELFEGKKCEAPKPEEPNQPSEPNKPTEPGKPTPPKPPTTTTPPTPPTTLEPKDPSKDPVNNGNANTGGGKNQDPGPGTYVPPNQMEQPPATPRPNPPKPAPTVPAPAPSNPKPTPTKDPAPAPSPEVSAPTPDAPAQGCSPAPGMSSC